MIVPARDAAGTIAATLEAIAGQRFDGSYEVIVVDNGSVDETAAIAQRLGVTVLRRRRGEGPAAARNAGAEAAAAPALAFTDGDCQPAPGWLQTGLHALQAADLVQGPVQPPPGVAAGPFDRTVWVRDEGLYETANLFVRREWWELAGGFCELLPSDGVSAPFGEDAWFGWRARRRGARTAYAADALVHHAVFPRRASAYVAERRRLERFPALVAQVPELRTQRLYARWFLNQRTAALDVALLGGLAGLATRRAAPAALAVAPYAALVLRASARWGARLGPRVAGASVAADLVGAAALVKGSWKWRTVVL